MLKKTILLYFADEKLNTADCIADIEKAVRHANGNLISRHNMYAEHPVINEYGDVMLTIEMPDVYIENFTKRPGMHLKGISQWLLHKSGNKVYREHTVGTRLLCFRSVDTNSS